MKVNTLISNVMTIVLTVFMTSCGSQPASEGYAVPKSFHSQQCYLTQGESYIWLEQEDEWLALPAAIRQQMKSTAINWLAENVFIVSMGQKPSAGYGIKLSNWLLEQHHWQVTRITHDPEPGSLQAMMISSPCVLVKIPKTIKSFSLKNEQDQVLGRWPY